MAGTLGTLTTSSSLSTGTTAKTMLQHTSPANIATKVKRASISFAGNSPTADKILVQLVRSATSGTGTTRNPAKVNASDAETLQSTGKENFSGEPSGGTVVFEELVHPQGGYTAPEEIKVKGGETLGWVVTAPASVGCRARFLFEE